MNTKLNSIKVINNAEINRGDFLRIQEMVYDYCGINLHDGKHALVKGRLKKRLRYLSLNSFRDYLNYVDSDESNREFLLLIDILTTNKTSFFRENQHFKFIREELIPQLGDRPVKWWSAGCSSGEEPITLAMILHEEAVKMRVPSVKILATDLSIEMIKAAKAGVYSPDKLDGVPNYLLSKYFDKGSDSKVHYKAKDSIRQKITYGRLNLLEPWPMKGLFQMIMCRNVMIYFDRQTQQKLVSRFYNLLEPGGYLFIGHSENVSNREIGLKAIIPAVYRKI